MSDFPEEPNRNDAWEMLRHAPISLIALLLACGLFVLSVAQSQLTGQSLEKIQVGLGALDNFSLWEEEWWRVFTTAFHHGGLIHLFFNGSALFVLGPLLERHIGSLRMFLFLISASAFSGVLQSLQGPWVGMSGWLYAVIGLLLVMRHRYHDVASVLNPKQVRAIYLSLVLGVVLSATGMIAIGNAAHFGGFFYGVITGLVCYGPRLWKMLWPIWLLAHLLLWPMFFYAMHPVWSGRYYWWQAEQSGDPDKQIELLKRATEVEPGLVEPWINLAILYRDHRRIGEAWRTVMEALRVHPTSETLLKLSHEMYDGMRAFQRQRALQTIREVMGEKAELWIEEFHGLRDFTRIPRLPDLKAPEPEKTPEEIRPVPRLAPQSLDELPPDKPGRLIPPSPSEPHSAELGVAT